MTAMLGELPTWKLEDLYSSPTGPDLDADLKRAAADAESFAKDYEGKVAALDGKALGAAVARFEKLSDLMGRIGSYASLYYAQNMAPRRRRSTWNCGRPSLCSSAIRAPARPPCGRRRRSPSTCRSGC